MINVALLTTGNEVINGEIIDTNASWCSAQLVEAGFNVYQRFTVSDDLESIYQAIQLACSENQVVIINGGLGPTTDDLTSEAAAIAAGCSLKENQYWLTQLDRYYKNRNREMPKSNLKQALLPEIADLVENPYGTACGFHYQLTNRLKLPVHCYFTPGVPHEFKAMVLEQIIPDLQKRFNLDLPQPYHRFYLFGLGESNLNDMLAKLNLNENDYEIGFRASTPFIEFKIRKIDKGITETQWTTVLNTIEALIKPWIVSENKLFAQSICDQLIEREEQLTLVELATAGFINYYLQSLSNNAMDLIKEAHVLKTFDHQFNETENNLIDTIENREINSNLIPLFNRLKYVVTKYQSDNILVTMDALDGEGQAKESSNWIGLITASHFIMAEITFLNNYSGDNKRNLLTALILDLLQRYWKGEPYFNSRYVSLEVTYQATLPRVKVN